MKTLNKTALTTFALVAINAQAIMVSPSFEKPILSLESAQINNFTQDIDGIDNLSLTLTQRKNSKTPTGLVLNAEVVVDDSVKNMQHKLSITQIETDNCGSTIYYASLAKNGDYQILPIEDSFPRTTQHRVNLVLTDHSTRLCDDYKPYRWEAVVREGFGFCGTQDTVIEFAGNLEAVYTIQN